MNITLRQLKIFEAVTRHLNFTKASEELHLTQPAVSMQIKQLEQAIEKKEVIILDVNGTGSYERGHIPGAIDFRANKDNIEALLGANKDLLVVAYCGGPGCSAYQAGAKAAEKAGFTKVKHLSAGISGWLDAKKAVEKKG